MTTTVNTFGLNVLNYAAAEQAMFTKMMRENFNYETISTFWSDLSIAEAFGLDSVKDTYERVLESWGRNTEMFTEFVMALNHKSWEHDSRRQTEISQLYADLYYKADEWISVNWDEDARWYYFKMTD